MIEVCQLTKRFGSQTILDQVNLCIETGESAVIIGRSGGGKSVLVKHLVGLLQPDAGEVFVDGENIVGKDERQLLRVREKFGMVFQGATLFDSMTVRENVAFPFRRCQTAVVVCFAATPSAEHCSAWKRKAGFERSNAPRSKLYHYSDGGGVSV